MEKLRFVILGYFIFCFFDVSAQNINLKAKDLKAVNVSVKKTQLLGRDVVKVIKDSSVTEVDEPTFAKLHDIDFKNGSIEVHVLSKLLPTAPEFARGFIGVAFRINDDNSQFEGIYVRPANARSTDQLRRNHSIQYFSFPDFKFDRLRKETAGQYESYADIGLNEWIKMKIVIRGAQAKLFINDNKEPSLIVNDLKHGVGTSGSIGLWVDVGTEGYFADLKVQKEK